MKALNISILVTLLTISSSAFSELALNKSNYRNEADCMREKWTLLREEIAPISQCKANKKLKLNETTMTFPSMKIGAVKVRYWEGQFEKIMKRTLVYKHDYINICTGKLTYSDTDSEGVESTYLEIYRIINPNLDEAITESFRLAPMTEKEALLAYKNLEIDCENNLSKE
jgi:hypothetical protein